MDIKIPDSLLRRFLDTKAAPEKIAEALTLCGPSVDRIEEVGNETVYEIEAITNRVDSASAFGIAREASAILPLFGIKAKLKNNPYEIKASELPKRESPTLPLTVEIRDESLVSRFSAIVLDHVKVSEAPAEIRSQLEASGTRSINNLVDITNYLTLCFGQPVHIFDYDKIKGAKMILRESQKGEEIVTLDGRKHKLLGGDIVIEDGEGRLIDLCGIMGAKNSEVDETTTRAVLFVQTYHPKKIRRTSLYTQERTLAAQIFEKQPDSRLVAPTLIEGVKLLVRDAKARVASDTIDLYLKKPAEKTVSLNLKWLSEFIGHKFDAPTVISILKNLGFTVRKKGVGGLSVAVPSWRAHDIEISEDLAEEVARIYGYFRLDSKLPESKLPDTQTDPLLDWEYQAKLYLAHLGFTEVFNYSLVSESLFEKASMKVTPSVRLKNPLASEFEYMRRSLIPSLLSSLSQNQGRSDPPLRLFELANIYLTHDHSTKNSLPEERPILAFAVQGQDYRTAKGYLEALLLSLGIKNISYEKDDESGGPWQKNQTAAVYSGKHFLGVFGRINTATKEKFTLATDVYLANLDFTIVSQLANNLHSYHPVSAYPDMVDDITIESKKPIDKLLQLIKQESPLITEVAYLNSFGQKHSFRIRFNNPEKNLTQPEVDSIKESLKKV